MPTTRTAVAWPASSESVNRTFWPTFKPRLVAAPAESVASIGAVADGPPVAFGQLPSIKRAWRSMPAYEARAVAGRSSWAGAPVVAGRVGVPGTVAPDPDDPSAVVPDPMFVPSPAATSPVARVIRSTSPPVTV